MRQLIVLLMLLLCISSAVAFTVNKKVVMLGKEEGIVLLPGSLFPKFGRLLVFDAGSFPVTVKLIPKTGRKLFIIDSTIE